MFVVRMLFNMTLSGIRTDNLVLAFIRVLLNDFFPGCHLPNINED